MEQEGPAWAGDGTGLAGRGAVGDALGPCAGEAGRARPGHSHWGALRATSRAQKRSALIISAQRDHGLPLLQIITAVTFLLW